ncbi:endonuclease domain-containing protein [Asticcacaulis biprosthecium]|uniref:endonuclease domain-containing protein n=1 Tax=Asticcacaulis biprosthecium TaxID=76891 RepID=UPI000A04B438
MKRDIRKLALAKEMRRELTTPEFLLWDRLKHRDGDGIAFRRQHPKGPYILDFYCHKVKLYVEVDGALHDSDRDERRDRWLNE